MFGNWIAQASQDARQDTNTVLGYQYQGSQARKGMRYDRRQENRMYQTARQRGLTPQEYYGSPAAGGIESTGTQIMGNSHGKMMDSLAKSENAVALQMTKMQTDAQKYSADKAAEAQGYSADKSFEGVMEKLKWDKHVFRHVTLPQATKAMKKTQQEINKLVNEVATSEPAWQKMMKYMTMGPENVLSYVMTEMAGLQDLDKLKGLSTAEKAELLQAMMAMGSVSAKEFAGTQWTAHKFFDAFGKALNDSVDAMKEKLKPGIEQTESDTPILGSQSNTSQWENQNFSP